jgi:D-xylose 1-dehydrogenase (NADP+, D-xylono-1,5-lactone-forming)
MANRIPLRWGLLGTARINRAVIPPIRSSKRSQLIAVASRDAQKASEYALTYGIPRFYSSYEDLLADPDIDIVYTSLPNSLHAEWSMKAMHMGKHVLCEKPITTSTQDLDALTDISRATGRIITEAYMYRHHPQTLLVKELVDTGEIGMLQLIQGSFCYRNTRASDIRIDPLLGGGSLWDVGCYPIGYANFITGETPTEVFGHQVTSPAGIDLLYAGQLSYRSGAICQFDCSFISESKSVIELTGDKGRLTVYEPYKPGKLTEIALQKASGEKSIKVKGNELYSGEIKDIEDAILNESSPRISLQESRGIITSIEALYLSSRLSEPIRMDEAQFLKTEQ